MALGASKISISTTSPLRVIAAASIGNALEWFDLLVYGYFAVTISRLFFPSSDQTVSRMLGFGTFGASYLVRPLGALVIGAYADKAGRKASLMVSVFLMTIGTLLMAIVPTYAIVGFFGRRRIRRLNLVSCRTRWRTKGLLRELPVGWARAGCGSCVAVWRWAFHFAHA